MIIYNYNHVYLKNIFINCTLNFINLNYTINPDENISNDDRGACPSNQNHKMYMYRNSSCVLVLVTVFW